METAQINNDAIVTEEAIFSISELSYAIKIALEKGFGSVKVKGEVGSIKYHTSGHAYFTLKDQESCIDAVCWRGNVSKQKVKLEEGLEIICLAKLTSYPARSKYQLIVDSYEIAGSGTLLKLLEDRKKKLASLGIFDISKKKKLPYIPKLIGIITSPTGAVIKDMIHRLSDRFPSRVILWPVLVQGDGAAEQVASAIKGFNSLNDNDLNKPDVIIVARGGGSLEDLMAFNEEIVAITVSESKIPIISAIGHETDTTLIDYAADLRAPTPTAAAELIVPVRKDLMIGLNKISNNLIQSFNNIIEKKSLNLQILFYKLPKPIDLIGLKGQKLDYLNEKLQKSIVNNLSKKQQLLNEKEYKLKSPTKLIEQYMEKLINFDKRIKFLVCNNINKLSDELILKEQILESYSYAKTLRRGFIIASDQKTKKIIKLASELNNRQNIRLIFADGERDVNVI